MFKQSAKEFFQSKSNWTGMTMVGGGLLVIYQKGDTSIALQGIFGGLALIFVKDAIVK